LVLFYKQRSYHQEISEKTANTGSNDSENSYYNVTQDKGKQFLERSSLAVNAWGPFVISYDQNPENGCLENYICVWAFKQRPVPVDQAFCTRCMLCLLQSWRFQLTALPGQTMQRAQNT